MPGLELKAVGVPAVNAKLVEGNTTHATVGPPVARLQVLQ